MLGKGRRRRAIHSCRLKVSRTTDLVVRVEGAVSDATFSRMGCEAILISKSRCSQRRGASRAPVLFFRRSFPGELHGVLGGVQKIDP